MLFYPLWQVVVVVTISIHLSVHMLYCARLCTARNDSTFSDSWLHVFDTPRDTVKLQQALKPPGIWLFRPNLCQANRFTLCCRGVFNYCISWHRGGLCVAICMAYRRISSLSPELLFVSPQFTAGRGKKVIKHTSVWLTCFIVFSPVTTQLVFVPANHPSLASLTERHIFI